ncbi:hypothetical protein ADL19_03945 [Streptomyces purpurogeneiscleroticus]|nr:hypothetical protein ADL19_03945 [Streptomyces purpurogeneiscleroticus]
MALAQVDFRDGQFTLMVRNDSGAIQAVKLDQQAVQLLMLTASKALASSVADPAGDSLMQQPMVDAEAVGLTTGSDGRGLLVLTVEIPSMPPMRFRFDDDLAREIVDKFRETLDTPMDVRLSMRAN